MPGRLLSVRIPSLAKLGAPSRCAKSMASDTGKKLIQIDVSSDTVCPWCFVGKKNLEKAMEQSRDKFDFEVRWHPFFLNPDAPKEGVRKSDFYKAKFGPVQYERVISRMAEIFRGLGLEYDMSGLTGDTMDSHRLIALAGHQGYDKQNALVGELFLNYFCEGKYIGDKQVLLDAARKVGIEGAEELFQDPTKGVDEVQEELKKYSSGISGVPHFVINDKYQLSGGQPPNVFMRAFEMAAKDGA
ncbi:hypothetical protein Zm00014a_024923 [Zea mays]|uniref:DSBA-like thioredoxin domain-containing protein n=2 Tax=Zea mays TaxID=4577 RepID=A0A3L6EL39_MAIZE|nr:uncharacterized protein LOC100194152 isoform X1 [Zea mays]PWZ21379.1 Uncharacterized protein YwbO [Zea mays]PWZ21380.1 hypothetical protein Zm00014a_024923 [Zea mays]PWZ21381.1 hypothetical protein Zm00014a_024923 [Zea mays]|eukprot:XP_008681231.1 uncharacterized protein LOC100194152 isoform X1 [Zea mays]